MADYDFSVGDEVVVRVLNSYIVPFSSSKTWDFEISSLIVAVSGGGYDAIHDYTEPDDYYIYIPHYISIKSGFILDERVRKRENIVKKFIGEKIVIVRNFAIVRTIKKAMGAFCTHCGDFSELADKNFTCFSCRQNPFRPRAQLDY